MMRILTVIAVGAGLCASAQEPASFRGRTELVPIYATVIDRQGDPVTDLTDDDFDVRDNGQRRPLAHFSSDLQPFSAVVMLDRSGSMTEHFDRIRDAAGEFVRQLGPGDRVRIGSFSREIRLTPPEFTSARDELMRALREDLQEIGPSPVWTALDESVNALLGQRGRRVVLLFSDGHDDPMHDQVKTSLDGVMGRVKRHEIMVYSIGFAATTTKWSGPVRRTRAIQLPRFGRTFGWTRHVQPPDPGLKEIAEESGGGYFELGEHDDLRATFARVADELHHQYLLAITPAAADGRVHDLTVKVRRRGVDVRARRSYVATR